MSLEGLRDYWLWLVTPIKAVEELINRSASWPVDYVKARWPELADPNRMAMLRRGKNPDSAHCSVHLLRLQRCSVVDISA